MKKLVINNNIKLLNYQLFLKNNYLKKNIKLKNILFETHLLLKKKNFNIIETHKYKNIILPKIKKKKNLIYTIYRQYENHLLFNYKLNFNILYDFNNIIFIKKNIKLETLIIKGRIVRGNKKKVLIFFFGVIFKMNSLELHKKKKLIYRTNKKKPNIFFSYKLAFLNFKINFFKKRAFSRKLYVQDINNKKRYITI